MKSKILNYILLILISACFSSLLNADIVWIDVRSQVEHSIDNIQGDVRVSHDDIVKEVSELFPEKNTEINLYCHSGGRAEKAMSALKEAGYINVSNVGGINDARHLRAQAARSLTE
jgi:phage shock protein E